MLSLHPLRGIPEVKKGDDIAVLIIRALKQNKIELRDRDILVVKQKIVSKAEGNVVNLDSVRPGKIAKRIAKSAAKDPRLVELILRESRRVVRMGHGVIITETKHGFVCANSGIDRSNVPAGRAALLPKHPDLSARGVKKAIETATHRRVAVIITDTFGRPWRKGQTDVAIGCSGISALRSYRGEADPYGYRLRVTEPATVDEIAGAAELVAGKLSGVPVVLVRGLRYQRGDAGVKSMLMERRNDLFR